MLTLIFDPYFAFLMPQARAAERSGEVKAGGGPSPFHYDLILKAQVRGL